MDYSPAGQLTSRAINNVNYRTSNIAGTTAPYCPNGLNQYATVGGSGGSCSGGQSYSYDDRGNLTSDGSRSFLYDLENKLTEASSGTAGTPTNWGAANWNAFQWSGPATTYLAYDPAGRLRQSDSTAGTQKFVYDGDALVAEYDNAGTILRRYVPGAGTDETLVWYEGSGTSTPNWLHTDEQGTTIATTDNGSPTPTATPYVYGPTGEPTSWGSVGAAPAFRYTGQVALPQVQLMYFKARMYDPALGRFLQTDPAGYSAGMNLYAYVMNNYANMVDPDGLDPNFICPDGTISNTSAPGCIESVESTGIKEKCGSSLLDFAANNCKEYGGIEAILKEIKGFAFDLLNEIDKPGPHHYHYRVTTMCPAKDVFEAYKNGGLSAPEAPPAKEGPNTNVAIAFGFHIDQFVSSRSGTITNVASPDHPFQGQVDIQIKSTGPGSTIDITGSGNGRTPLTNDLAGFALFGLPAFFVGVGCSSAHLGAL